MTDNTQVGEEIGRRISTNELGYDKATIQELTLPTRDKPVPIFLCRFIGEARDLKAYQKKAEGDRPASIGYGFLGEFEGTGANGVVKTGTVLYLPGYLEDMVSSAMSGGENAVRLAVDIYATYDADAATSYVFTGRNLIKQESPAVDSIKAQIASMPLPALPLA